MLSARSMRLNWVSHAERNGADLGEQNPVTTKELKYC